MNIKTQQCGAVSVVQPDGPLIGEAGEILKSQLQTQIKEHLGRVVLDASTIPYLDSLGLESLVEITEELGLSGQALKLCHPNPTVKEVFDLTGLSHQFEFYEDTHAAVRSFL